MRTIEESINTLENWRKESPHARRWFLYSETLEIKARVETVCNATKPPKYSETYAPGLTEALDLAASGVER